MGVRIVVREGEPISQALRRLKRELQTSGMIGEARRRAYPEDATQERRANQSESDSRPAGRPSWLSSRGSSTRPRNSWEASTMTHNPILDELYTIRERLLADAGGDLQEFLAGVREREAAS